MSYAKFCYNNNQSIIIQCNDDSPLTKIIEKYCVKSETNINNIKFLLNLNEFKPDFTIGEIKSILKNKEINFEVVDSYSDPRIISDQIICKKCFSIPKLIFKDYKISFDECECKSRDRYKNILLNEFEETQKLFDDDLNKSNNIQKQMRCEEHNDLFCSYCKTCNKDLCLVCRGEHISEYKKHNVISLSDFFPNKDKLLKDYKALKTEIDEINDIIVEYIAKLEKVKKSLGALENIAKKFSEYNPKERNFVIFNNINNFKYDNITKDLNAINNIKNINKRSEKIMDLHDKMIFTNEINIFYDINEDNKKDKKIKIFGNVFVKNNKNMCRIIYKNKLYELNEYFPLINEEINSKNNEENEKKEIKSDETILLIKLIDVNNISNISNIFNQCTQLISLPDISKINMINMTNISNMFNGCTNLKCLPDISRWNTRNITNMEGLFKDCSSLESILNLSKWNTNKVETMRDLFNGCSKLKEIEISNWDVSNVKTMKNMFNGCSSLISLPGLEKWNVQKEIDISNMFDECKQLKHIPNFAKASGHNDI